MHSKLLPWDFIQKYPQTIELKARGVVAFLVNDPYVENIITSNLPKKEYAFHCYLGSEITKDFIEEHFCNLSFFSQSENIYILNAELIPAQNLALFNEKIAEISEQYVLLFFSKTNKQYVELQKNSKVSAVTIESPRFWDGAKILQLSAKAKNISLNPTISRFLLDNLEHNFESIFRALDIIKISFNDGEIDLNKLKELILRERFDFFELIDLYCQNSQKFYEIILSNDLDFDWLRSLASFMQGHFSKVLFPAEIKSKEKPTKYDQSIIYQSEKLNRERVKNDVRFFAELEILAKSRDQLILNHLRRKIIT
jgi:DNA polymerase III delta subunit